jgi:hypothetical protein
MKEKDMKKFELTIEQIKSTYLAANIYHDVPNKKIRLTLNMEPFGEVTISEDFHILINYTNPYLINFEIFESFFKTRLKVEGYEPYIYEKKIVLYKRAITASNDFECSIKRANSFIEIINCIEKFIAWNETLNEN